MEDKDIVALYFMRDQAAITETASKYGKCCHFVSYNILQSNEDAEECVNDTYLHTWNSVPPEKPQKLSTYLGKITRNLSINRYNGNKAQKRGGGQIDVALTELEECISCSDDAWDKVEEKILTQKLNGFLKTLPDLKRNIFVRRYWYLCSVNEIAAFYKISESKVKSVLFRLRNQLKKYLEGEGVL